jgi:hypothetical protein
MCGDRTVCGCVRVRAASKIAQHLPCAVQGHKVTSRVALAANRVRQRNIDVTLSHIRERSDTLHWLLPGYNCERDLPQCDRALSYNGCQSRQPPTRLHSLRTQKTVLRHNSRSPGRDPYHGPPEYKRKWQQFARNVWCLANFFNSCLYV